MGIFNFVRRLPCEYIDYQKIIKGETLLLNSIDAGRVTRPNFNPMLVRYQPGLITLSLSLLYIAVIVYE